MESRVPGKVQLSGLWGSLSHGLGQVHLDKSGVDSDSERVRAAQDERRKAVAENCPRRGRPPHTEARAAAASSTSTGRGLWAAGCGGQWGDLGVRKPNLEAVQERKLAQAEEVDITQATTRFKGTPEIYKGLVSTWCPKSSLGSKCS